MPRTTVKWRNRRPTARPGSLFFVLSSECLVRRADCDLFDYAVPAVAHLHGTHRVGTCVFNRPVPRFCFIFRHHAGCGRSVEAYTPPVPEGSDDKLRRLAHEWHNGFTLTNRSFRGSEQGLATHSNGYLKGLRNENLVVCVAFATRKLHVGRVRLLAQRRLVVHRQRWRGDVHHHREVIDGARAVHHPRYHFERLER